MKDGKETREKKEDQTQEREDGGTEFQAINGSVKSLP